MRFFIYPFCLAVVTTGSSPKGNLRNQHYQDNNVSDEDLQFKYRVSIDRQNSTDDNRKFSFGFKSPTDHAQLNSLMSMDDLGGENGEDEDISEVTFDDSDYEPTFVRVPTYVEEESEASGDDGELGVDYVHMYGLDDFETSSYGDNDPPEDDDEYNFFS